MKSEGGSPEERDKSKDLGGSVRPRKEEKECMSKLGTEKSRAGEKQTCSDPVLTRKKTMNDERQELGRGKLFVY